MNSKNILVRKRFKCIKCKEYESQLVNSTKVKIKCSNCGGLLNEITENEYKIQKNKNNLEDKKKNESIKVKKNNLNNNPNTNNKIPSNNKTTTYKGVKININSNPNRTNNNSKNNIEKEKELLKQKEEEEKLKERIEKEKERQRLRFKSSNHIENTKNQNNQNQNNVNIINQNNFFSNYLNNRNNIIRERNINENINRDNMLGDIFRGIYNIMTNGMNSESNEPQILTFQSDDNNGPIIIKVNRHNINDDIYDQSFSHFGSNFNNNFRDNFSSNFRSNLGNFFTQLIEIVRRNREDAERKKNHPTKKEVLDKLKKFPMSTKYCKKVNGNKFEFPQCSICLNDINKSEKTVLLPCGHMFHWDCCLKWLQSKNTCPVCRFELPAEDS